MVVAGFIWVHKFKIWFFLFVSSPWKSGENATSEYCFDELVYWLAIIVVAGYIYIQLQFIFWFILILEIDNDKKKDDYQ